jgi:hypothetical protein
MEQPWISSSSSACLLPPPKSAELHGEDAAPKAQGYFY